ncbi:MAG: hypothetical protein CMH46_16315 [Muricauda sp.]|jgi:YegS/Rv2252/BmrU family lipid kinase|nr:diacylglycerol kinase family protein [Allomuricauda sp.]MAU17093.1 hypothetical protein [Allomuricauda sp.]|tara:strand:- start:13969 stop:14865 length:897 start_codon:yes stop_codon:yes gene_type:complete
MDHFLFVVNPISGDRDKSALVAQIARLNHKYKTEFTLLYTKGKKDERIIGSKIAALCPSRIVACGGDGTINLVAKLLLGSKVPLGIVPVGSANGLSTALDLPEDSEAALELCFNGESFPIDALKINASNYIFHMGDFGFNAKMIKTFEENSTRGMMAYAGAFFKSLKEKETVTSQYTVKANNSTSVYEADMVVIANAARYGTGAVVSPNSRLDDGTFEIVVFKPIPLVALANLTLSAFLGSIEDSPYVEIIKTDKAEIKVDRPQYFQVDGQSMGKLKKIRVAIQTKTLRVVLPWRMKR